MPTTQLMNISLTQTVYLQAAGTSTRVWLVGNGTSAFTVKSATLSQGSVSRPITVNGHTSFQVPALGRWSDYISTAGFTLPGNVTISSVVFGEVPIINMGETGGTGWEPGVVTGVAYNLATNLIANTFVFVTNTPTGELTFTQTANLNMSLDGAYADEILDRIIAYIAGTEYTRTGNVLLATTTQDGFYSNPGENVDSVISITLKYYVSNVITGTVTVCIDVSIYTSPFNEEMTSEVFAAFFGLAYDTMEPGCATVVGSKIYVTLTAAQLAKITLLGIEYKDKYYSAGVPFTITIKDNDAFNSHPTPYILFGLEYENPSGGSGWGWEFRFVDTPTSGSIAIGETAEVTALNIVDYINTYGTTVGVTATYVGNSVVSVVPGTDNISTYCNYSAREEMLAVFEFSESSGSASQDPTMVMSSIYILPLIAMQSVFDDPSVVDGPYEEPTLPGVTEVFSTETITVDDNSVIADGDTLTINIGTYPIIYTFKNLPTGAKNEILIGGTADITAANIATALNATDGAIFVATSLTNVVSITDYTAETVTKTTTSAGLTIGEIIPIGSYGTLGLLPAFTGEGFCGDGTGFLPAFTGAGTCTQDDFCIGRGVLPAATCNAQSFITGVSYSSTDAEKISLLLNGNGFMQNFAPMVCVTDPDEAALLAVQFVANYITYAPDLTTWSVADYWIDPRATLYYATGDCEDGAFLLASILLNLGVSHTKVRVAIGTYNGVGHAWVLYQRDSDGLWVLLDWTAGATYWNAISDIDDLSIAYSTSGYNPTEYVTAYYVSDVASVTSSVFMYDNALTAWLQVVTEALEFADSVTRGLGIGIHDWLTLKDTQANNWNGKETVPDALMLYDLATGYQRYSVSVADSLGIADAATRALLIAVLEKLHFTDLAGMIATISKTATDSLDLTDFAGNTYLDTITEALSLVDVASILKTTYGVVSEALAFADTLSGYRNLPLSATSTLTLSETVSAKGTFYRAVYDTIIMNVMVELAGEVYECYVLNTPKFLPSMYSGFNFNSYCVFENRAFAANGTGIYELTGDTDAGTAIHSGVLMHNSDFGSPHQKRFRRGYLGISGGSPVMVLETEDGGRLAYTIDNNGKAVFSHEQKSKKWTLSVSDFDELDSIKLIPVILSR